MPVKYCIPIIPSADLERSLRLWVDGLQFSTSTEMHKDGKLIFCMLHKENLCFMLNQRAGTPAKPESVVTSSARLTRANASIIASAMASPCDKLRSAAISAISSVKSATTVFFMVATASSA